MSRSKKKRHQSHSHSKAPIPTANEASASPQPIPTTRGSIWFLPTPKAKLLSKDWLADNVVSILGIAANFLTLVVLIYTLQSYRGSNVITQNSLEFTRKTWQISRLPFLGVAGMRLLPEKANGEMDMTYTVVNDTDNPAIITRYDMYPYPTRPDTSTEDIESNERDWISPHAQRPRVFRIDPIGQPAVDKFVHDGIMSGQMELNLKISAEDIFHDALVFSFIYKYSKDLNAFVIVRTDVIGLPEKP